MIQALYDGITNSLGLGKTCDRCGINYQPDQRSLTSDVCPACVSERVGDTSAYDGHGVDQDTVAEMRQQGMDLCAVTGEWHDIDDLVVMRIPIYDDRQDDFITRDTISARVLDQPHVRRWAKEASELKETHISNPVRDQQLQVRADRPKHPERNLSNLTPDSGVYIGVPKRHRPYPTEKILYYNDEMRRETVSPRPEIVDDSFPQMHDWGKSTSNNSGAITAASLIAYEYNDPVMASNLAYPLQRRFIGTDRFALRDGIWFMTEEELREEVDAVADST